MVDCGNGYLGNDRACTILGIGDVIIKHANGKEHTLTNMRCLSASEHDDVYVWHSRLGHLSEHGMNVLEDKKLIPLFENSSLELCVNCIMSKQHRVNFKRHESHGKLKVLELVYSDVCGHMNVKSLGGCGSFVSNSANLVKLQALVSSIQAASTNQLNPHHIFTTNLDVHQLHRGNHFNPDGRLSHWINCITDAIRLAGNPCLHHIPKEWSRPASKLAIHGLSLHVITMFHQAAAPALAPAPKANCQINLDSTLNTSSSWLSPSGRFTFGFYPEGSDGFKVGIQFIESPNKTTVIWTSNRDKSPVSKNATLKFGKGGLKLLWANSQGEDQNVSNSDQSSSAYCASMLDSGNFVIYDSNNTVKWQTFDSPTDTLMAGQVLRSENDLVASVSETNHSKGRFLLRMQADSNLVMYLIPSDFYWSSGTSREGYSILNLGQDGILFLTNKDQSQRKNLTQGDQSNNPNTIHLARIDPNGVLYVYAYDLLENTSNVLDTRPDDQCKVKGICGFNSFCSSSGEKQLLQTTAAFEVCIENRRHKVLSQYRVFIKRTVRRNTTVPGLDGVSGVVIKKELSGGPLIVFVVVVSGLIIFIFVFFFIVFKCQAGRYRMMWRRKELALTDEIAPISFSYYELYDATEGFKEEVGKGAFGTVFRGTLQSTGKVVAVKRLEKVMEEGEKEFQTEMKSIGRTQYRNLVRLLGFCNEGSNRLLVYEFMSNGSLADLIFKPDHQNRPPWNDRSRIALDVARGLHYLHEDCETHIIHCDIKPQNILMDENRSAKISDFGLAKLLMPTQTRIFTGVRGTRGYLAPEWQQNTPITVKTDVYSFGIVVLEILCCRKNMELEAEVDEIILSKWVYSCYLAGELEKLVLDEEVDMVEFERVVKVALWCIQTDPIQRPSMKNVIIMLEGCVEISSPPQP
ncbi:G-type lectin S-receptor-like serine/threonine-protein kinase LECRK1 [Dioscorea cayenensis subsp. rotundata]|uniref:non-specific serine/threonine protein kinase n=1 Tax=Dioscorea cayennensis subsp. rotundata TaxID=55577 RepID=A0AB40BDM3_DIOCR|nr:G-type lectin S-receptor-like serine/threonine-protein kinase LECRK1 [Dioscorea cayenensis subsp. rotundata]